MKQLLLGAALVDLDTVIGPTSSDTTTRTASSVRYAKHTIRRCTLAFTTVGKVRVEERVAPRYSQWAAE